MQVNAAVKARLTLGAVLPAGATVASITLDGRPVATQRITTARGDELITKALPGRHTLVITLR